MRPLEFVFIAGLCAGIGCSSPQDVSRRWPTGDFAVRFVVTAEGSQIVELSDPIEPTDGRFQARIEEGQTLYFLGLTSAGLAGINFDAGAEPPAALELRADPKTCPQGRLVRDGVFAFELPSDTRAVRMSELAAADETIALDVPPLSDLALHVEERVSDCGFDLSPPAPFAATEEVYSNPGRFGIQQIAVVDPDRVIVVGFSNAQLVERGLPVRTSSQARIKSETIDPLFTFRGAAVDPFSAGPDRRFALTGIIDSDGGAVIRGRLAGDALIVEDVYRVDRQMFQAAYTPTGRLVAVGDAKVVTFEPGVAPVEREPINRSELTILEYFDLPGRPFLLGTDEGEFVEGDPSALLTTSLLIEGIAVNDTAVTDVDVLDPGQGRDVVVATKSSGAFRRNGPGAFNAFPLFGDARVLPCGGTVDDCGRHQASFALAATVVSSDGSAMLIAPLNCTQALMHRTHSTCSTVINGPHDAMRIDTAQGLTAALSTDDGRYFLATHTGLYEGTW